ncbi:hypothetical protein [Hoylesella loescheii]|uniref:Uncharacterized protein n=1 Tax=Hoylesella loescheii DSM 19665 = JCM 12249 = ATCC 15930 TaxID=1122985 RepID=A0A069QJW9_HOYLO|nr:hypothetical protein [Hoylesella loescheii]KDR52349.1 hypothetical protein HMPREF1991_01531 [Hoylesella loescheii DSM 19665 = JCM 12249 = ATCC 15930]
MDKETFEKAKELFQEREKIKECIDFLEVNRKRLRLVDDSNHDNYVVIIDQRLIAMFDITAHTRCREIKEDIDNL